MLKRKQLIRLARIRIKEAQVLFAKQCYDGAYYLAGYAVECGLKACIAKKTQRHDFPDKKIVTESHVHDLAKLVAVADLKTDLETQRTADPQFARYWALVSNWNEASRYQRTRRATARALLEAIDEPNHGVLQWIEHHW
jgi:hypothetical protein